MTAGQLLAGNRRHRTRKFVAGMGAHQRPQVLDRLVLGLRQQPIQQPLELLGVGRVEQSGHGRRADAGQLSRRCRRGGIGGICFSRTAGGRRQQKHEQKTVPASIHGTHPPIYPARAEIWFDCIRLVVWLPHIGSPLVRQPQYVVAGIANGFSKTSNPKRKRGPKSTDWLTLRVTIERLISSRANYNRGNWHGLAGHAHRATSHYAISRIDVARLGIFRLGGGPVRNFVLSETIVPWKGTVPFLLTQKSGQSPAAARAIGRISPFR